MKRHRRILIIVFWIGASLAPMAAAQVGMPIDAQIATIDSLWGARQSGLAEALVDSLIPEARAAGDSTALLELLSRSGRMKGAFGRGHEAEPRFREALALSEALGDSSAQRGNLRWLGVALGMQGESAKAREIYDRLLILSDESGDLWHAAWALTGQAYCEEQAGQLGAARTGYESAVILFRQLKQLEAEMFALNGLSNALSGLGEFDEAIESYRRVATVASEIGNLFLEAIAENNLGTIEFSLGDPGRAMDHFSRATELHRDQGNLRERILSESNVAISEASLGRFRQAVDRLERLVGECREAEIPDLRNSILVQLAQTRLRQGHSNKAARIYRDQLAKSGGLIPKEKLESLVGLSDALAAMDSTRAGYRVLVNEQSWARSLEGVHPRILFEVELGLRELELGMYSPAIDRFVASADGADSLGIHSLQLRALAGAVKAARLDGQTQTARDLLARAIALWESEREVPLDPEWRERRGEISSRIYGELVLLEMPNLEEVPSVESVRKTYNSLQTFKSRTLLERMRGPGPVGEAAVFQPTSLADLQSRVLREGDLLLDFFLSSDQSYLFAVSKEECRAVRLPGSEQLENRLRLFHEFLASPAKGASTRFDRQDRKRLDAMTASLSDLLLGELSEQIAASDHLIYAPDGALNLLPLHLLLSDATVAALGDEAANLGNSGSRAPTIQWVPSATFLALSRAGAAHASSQGNVLGLGGHEIAGGRRLTAVERELRSLSSRFRSVTIDPHASPDSLLTMLGDFSLLHFAAHSSLDDQSPWRSGIYLDSVAGQGSEATDSLTVVDEWVLRASDIASLHLSAQLVVLSSCQSASGRILSGEGVQGLSSAFLIAGVPAVLASLWPVDDAATARFMEEFYRALGNGEAAATALLSARRVLGADAATAHPFFWAGFVLAGDGDARPELRLLGSLRAAIAGFVLIVLLTAYLLLRRRARLGAFL